MSGSDRTRSPSLATKAALSATGTLAVTVGGAAATIVVARVLGPTRTGDVVYAIWVALVASQIAGMALPQAAMRYLAAEGAGSTGAIARWVATRSLASAVVAAALGAAIAHFGVRTGATALAIVTSALAALQTLGTAGQALLAGRQSFRALAVVSGVSAAVQVAGVWIGAVTRGSSGALGGYAAAQGVLAAAVLLDLRGAKPIPPDLRRRMRSYVLHAWVATVVSLFTWSRLELIFLEHSSGPGAVALYSVALTLAQLATQPTLLIAGALLPHFSALQASGVDRLEATFGTVTRILAAVTLPVCFGLAALSPALVEVLFGTAFAGAVAPSAIVVAFASFGAVGAAASSLLYGVERASFISRTGVVAAVAAVALYAVAIPRWGVIGAGAARSCVQGAATLAGFVFVARVLRLRVPIRNIVRSVAAAVPAAVAGGLVPFLAGRTWFTLVSGIGVVMATYGSLGRALRVLDRIDVDHMQNWLETVPLPARRQLRAIVAFLAHAPVAGSCRSAAERNREASP